MIWEVQEFQGKPGGGSLYEQGFFKPAVIKTIRGIYILNEKETLHFWKNYRIFFQKYNVQWRLTYPEIFVPMPNRPDR